MRRALAAVDLRDVIAVIGLCLIAGGLAFVSAAAALAVPGALIFLYAALPPLLRRRD